ncbi:helix-turn-helix domain-containing protein [Aerococcus urinaeequi]|uniref:helix-turn-helix domain-containing protein n=1 Tax=Aerococcus urinaeequi TaxID=51665 RepID=UPI003ED9BDA7
MSIGTRIKELRLERKMTQKDFAKEIGISRSYLGDLENDRKSPSAETISKLSDKLNVSSAYFFGGEKEPLNSIENVDDDEWNELLDTIPVKNYLLNSDASISSKFDFIIDKYKHNKKEQSTFEFDFDLSNIKNDIVDFRKGRETYVKGTIKYGNRTITATVRIYIYAYLFGSNNSTVLFSNELSLDDNDKNLEFFILKQYNLEKSFNNFARAGIIKYLNPFPNMDIRVRTNLA